MGSVGGVERCMVVKGRMDKEMTIVECTKTPVVGMLIRGHQKL